MGKNATGRQHLLSEKPMQIKFPAWQEAEIDEAVKISGKTRVEIVRLATEAGMEYLKSINYRVGKVVFEHAEAQREKL